MKKEKKTFEKEDKKEVKEKKEDLKGKTGPVAFTKQEMESEMENEQDS